MTEMTERKQLKLIYWLASGCSLLKQLHIYLSILFLNFVSSLFPVSFKHYFFCISCFVFQTSGFFPPHFLSSSSSFEFRWKTKPVSSWFHDFEIKVSAQSDSQKIFYFCKDTQYSDSQKIL